MTSDSLGGVSPPPPVDEHAEFQRLRREELQRLDARIKENSATVRTAVSLDFVAQPAQLLQLRRDLKP